MLRRIISVACVSALTCLSEVSFAADPLVDTQDVRLGGSPETEGSIFVSPIDPDVVFLVNNPGKPWISVDGGINWSNGGALLPGSGDPAAVIVGDTLEYGPHGRFLAGHLGIVTPQTEVGPSVSFKDTPDSLASWTSEPLYTDSVKVDKLHLWVDNSPFSGTPFNVYAVWSNVDTDFDVEFAASSDGGDTWGPKVPLWTDSTDVEGSFGVNIQTGRSGRVYVMWPIQKSPGPHAITARFGFNESPGNPISFAAQHQILLQGVVRGMDGEDLRDKGNSIRAVSYPSMCVDWSDPEGDKLYVVWAERAPGTNNGTDIRLMKGFRHTDSTTVDWDEENLVTVNQDRPPSDQWWPWIAWDECTGMLVVVFMDSRKDYPSQAQAEAYVAVSDDEGSSWSEIVVSDDDWSPDTSIGYDYIGVAAGDGRAFALWSDDRTGVMRAYVSRILLWGVEQDSVSISEPVFSGSDMTVTATWTTNLAATVDDRLTLISPNDSIVSPFCSTCADTTSHSVTMTVPCEPGMWKYTASSERRGCTEIRTSDVDSFFVEPEVELVGRWPITAPTGGQPHACPAGDAFFYTVELPFEGSCVAHIAANRMELEALPVNQPNLAFFPQSVVQPADSAATSDNGYATTITERQVGGCGSDSAEVYLDGVGIGKVFVSFIANLDLTGDGFVDASES
jgi:hypothetical protein